MSSDKPEQPGTFVPREPHLEYTIGFGEPDWQAHIGGNFDGPEHGADLTWNWLGKDRGWCVLPKLSHEHDYLIRIEAAPLAPFGCRVQRVVITAGESELLNICLPDSTSAEAVARLALPKVAADVTSINARISLERSADPTLRVFANDLPVAELSFEPEGHLQYRDFYLRREVLNSTTALFFQAAQAFGPQDIPDSPDKRMLSFRLFRMLIFRIG